MNRVVHKLRIGGVSKDQLLRQLDLKGVQLNSAAQDLFAHDLFTTEATPVNLEVHELAVEDLGLARGGTNQEVVKAAAILGLAPCPLEVAPHLRLQYIGQPEGHIGHPETKNCAPPGSMTVISVPLSDDYETPKGFYLRKISGTLWLRGYRSDNEYIWSAKDRLAFCRASSAA